MSGLEKLKQYIIEHTNYFFISLLMQYKNEYYAYKDIINTLEKSKVNFYTQKLSRNNAQRGSFKNQIIDKQIIEFEEIIKDKNREIIELKRTYKKLLKNKHKYFNRLKTELEKSAKKNTMLKEIFYNEDNVFTEYIRTATLLIIKYIRL